MTDDARAIIAQLSDEECLLWLALFGDFPRCVGPVRQQRLDLMLRGDTRGLERERMREQKRGEEKAA